MLNPSLEFQINKFVDIDFGFILEKYSGNEYEILIV